MNYIATYATFALYLIGLIIVGVYFYTKSKKLEDYLLGGRGMGSWVTALSAQASDMSGWLLMGLPGAVYLFGLNQVWIAVGLAIGTYLNWYFVAARLRIYTDKTNSLTLPSFFGSRFNDPTNLLRLISSAIILLFFTVYAAAGLVGAGKLFESMFNISYLNAVIIGTFIMVFYTMLGGFLAVCWTDLFQGALMFFAIIILPIIAFFSIEPGAISATFNAKSFLLNPIPEGNWYMVILGIISTAAWGLGYFGQPHILSRFMSVKTISLLPKSRRIAMVWVMISLVGAVIIGLLSIVIYPDLPRGSQEKVLIFMVIDFLNPYFAGIVFAAILAAIMSTIDSQLIVSSSTLVEDIYANIIKKNASDKEQLLVSRLAVVLVSLVSFSLAMDKDSNIFSLVTFAWGGFGAAFGPVVLMAIYSKKTTWYSALSGMVAGTFVMLGWYFAGLGQYMYEIVPGFIANFAIMFIINYFKPNENKEIITEFNIVEMNIRNNTTPDYKR